MSLYFTLSVSVPPFSLLSQPQVSVSGWTNLSYHIDMNRRTYLRSLRLWRFDWSRYPSLSRS